MLHCIVFVSIEVVITGFSQNTKETFKEILNINKMLFNIKCIFIFTQYTAAKSVILNQLN